MDKEIIWNIVNSALAGCLVLLGACVSGDITLKGLLAALVAGGIIALTKFKEYWETEKEEYSSKTHIFSFLG